MLKDSYKPWGKKIISSHLQRFLALRDNEILSFGSDDLKVFRTSGGKPIRTLPCEDSLFGEVDSVTTHFDGDLIIAALPSDTPDEDWRPLHGEFIFWIPSQVR